MVDTRWIVDKRLINIHTRHTWQCCMNAYNILWMCLVKTKIVKPKGSLQKKTKKVWTIFCYCTVQFCTVRYCTVQGTTPPHTHKSEIFFFAFLDESGHFQCFPKGFRKKPKKSKKKFGFGRDPPPGLENFQTFLVFFWRLP